MPRRSITCPGSSAAPRRKRMAEGFPPSRCRKRGVTPPTPSATTAGIHRRNRPNGLLFCGRNGAKLHRFGATEGGHVKKISKFRIGGRRERAAIVLVVGALVAVAVVAVGQRTSGGSSVPVLTATFKDAQGAISTTGAQARLTAGENEGSEDGIR